MTLDEEKQGKIQGVFDKLPRRRARPGVPMTKGQFAWVCLANRIACAVALFVVLRWLINTLLLVPESSSGDSRQFSIIAALVLTMVAIGTSEITWLVDKVGCWVLLARSIGLEEKHAREVAEWSRKDSRVADICAAWMVQDKVHQLAWHDYRAPRKAQAKITEINDRCKMLKQEDEVSSRIDDLLDEAGIARKAHAVAQNQILDQKTEPATGRQRLTRP